MLEKLLQVSEMSSSDIIKEFKVLNKKIIELTLLLKPVDSFTILSPKEVMNWLKISAPTLNEWSKKGIIQKFKLGNRCYFQKEQIIACLTGTKHSDKIKNKAPPS